MTNTTNKIFTILLTSAIGLGLTSCSWFEARDNKPVVSEEVRAAEILQKKNLYCELSRERIEKQNYAHSRCDGLLFTALHAIGCDYPLNLDKFEDNGRWYRSPTHDCYPGKNNGADSTISKDMIVGASLYLVLTSDDAAIQRFVDYCEDHKVLGGAACKIGDSEDLVASAKIYYPYVSLKVLKDYLSSSDALPEESSELSLAKEGFLGHLEVISILLRGAVYHGITDSETFILNGYIKDQPRNAVYQAAYALYTGKSLSPTYDILLDETLFPSDRLPTSKNYCTDYLFQRAMDNQDWKPCDRGETHDGTDFIFAASIALGEVY